MRWSWLVTVSFLFVAGCTSAVDLLSDAGDSGVLDDAGEHAPADAGASDATPDGGGEMPAPSCCLDQRCPTCPGGRYQIGGCGPDWCGPPFPTSCPRLPEPCPECGTLGEASCPRPGDFQTALGCVAQECRTPEGRRFVACVSRAELEPVAACP